MISFYSIDPTGIQFSEKQKGNIQHNVRKLLCYCNFHHRNGDKQMLVSEWNHIHKWIAIVGQLVNWLEKMQQNTFNFKLALFEKNSWVSVEKNYGMFKFLNRRDDLKIKLCNKYIWNSLEQ